MRTLKKALCLVLVLAMVLSLGVSAFAVDKALDYKDYASVTNKEAVDVLTALSVIHGNDDGTFGPAGNFTRAQAATMITYLMLGTTTANALPTTATQFNDVPASHWAAKYVQYCANDKIINGYGDGKFGPDDKLTNTQWALMLLGALGYKASNEQIGGSGWEIQVTKLAMSAGIANADDFAATFNRDMAAKMALNTLKAAVVEYDSDGQTITVTGDSSTTTINTGATKAEKVTQAASGTADRLGNTDYYQFGEQHFAKLELHKGTTDPAGRPSHTWELKDKTIGEYPDAATLTYVNSFTGKTEKDLKKQGYDFDSATISYNGGEGVLALTDLYNGEKSAVNGYTIEIFANEDKEISDIVVTETYFAQVQKFTAATSTKDASVRLTVWEHANASGVSMTITDDPDVDNDIYDKIAAAYEAKDYLLVYCNPGWETKAATAEDVIFDAAAVTTVEGQITRFTNNGKISTSTVAMDGTTYKLANEFVTPGNASGATNANAVASTLAAKNKGTLYLDANNSVVAYMGEASTGDKAILVTSSYVTLENGKLTTKVSGITSNGETTELVVTNNNPAVGVVYTYAYNSTDDDYTLNAAAAMAAPSASNKDQAIAMSSSAAITKTSRALSVGGASTYFANDVKFVFWNSNNKTATVKTGVQPVAAGNVSAVAVRDNGNGGYYISAVYVNAAPADEGVTSSDIIYVAKVGVTGSILVDGQKKDIYYYDAYVNGEKIDDFYSTDSVGVGYYKSAKNETTGAYLLTGYAYTTDNDTTAATVLNKTNVDAYDSTLQIVNEEFSLDGAVIVDLTTAGDGITTTVSVTALYNADTKVASVVYVVDR